MENEIRFVQGCLDCPFYNGDIITKCMKPWCSAKEAHTKDYRLNKMPKDCPLRIKNITISADIK